MSFESVSYTHLGQSKVIPQFINWLENESFLKSLWQQIDLSKINWTKVQSYLLNGASGTFSTVMSTASKVVSALTTVSYTHLDLDEIYTDVDNTLNAGSLDKGASVTVSYTHLPSRQ